MKADLSGNMWSVAPALATVVRSEGKSVLVGKTGAEPSNFRRALGRRIVGVFSGWTALQDG